ncbi:MAG: S-methyl-5-thioribose-1-phosphate isomerase [Candidatus Cloacimonadales bacterium]|jgi:translation initiation factor eIF-2B subunit alpha/methylthioribose-1-phosphate isomerase|nr:S-methyl-5-thioribose-1-phosphate isomerase [Candidatus Cloacimonadota bacterium]MDY0381190.1 S-methyl-5-thioribose-1-phosphate isomerase [Candidatus Cloacimonadaceae bacterium]HCM16207.1 S-methyl-5-thioribose-1-phosphate isomerase [Candidatus Cloacimonas sp.]MCB5255888.1 S-methyl-5-thioribose-1-phosphate isomerase [Candidatus Cloacimonadota bacterium]MCB5264245.1 S-methyl-5-thioribose-1-phosphate isomerase [Candidatus Cloacimonadota bacterium]
MQINGHDYRSVWFDENRLKMIDQNKLPFEFCVREYGTYMEIVTAIRDMIVRGAPAIGAAGAFGMALAAISAPQEKFRAYLRSARNELLLARPTAVDLSIGVNYVYESALKFIPDINHARNVALLAANEFANRSAMECLELGNVGSELIRDGFRILTHCNAGALATVDHGTALSVIRQAHKQGKNIFVYVDETRPRFQGSRLTAYELEQEGIPHAIIADSAGGFYFWKNEIDIVITGADRICLNGDVANKIGTYEKAVLAKAHDVPFYVAAPLSTFDFSCQKGENIPIEIRDEAEIKCIGDVCTANPGSTALNPAFDITPAAYISGIITPKGVFEPEGAAQKVQQ